MGPWRVDTDPSALSRAGRRACAVPNPAAPHRHWAAETTLVFRVESIPRRLGGDAVRGPLRWLVSKRPQKLITGPLIYGLVIPLLLLGLCVSVHPWACLPIYGITGVRRSDHLVFDRRHLEAYRLALGQLK